jgi:hypothetical protein
VIDLKAIHNKILSMNPLTDRMICRIILLTLKS